MSDAAWGLAMLKRIAATRQMTHLLLQDRSAHASRRPVRCLPARPLRASGRAGAATVCRPVVSLCRGQGPQDAGLAYAATPVSNMTRGSSPTVQASCPGSRTNTSPAPTVTSVPSSDRSVDVARLHRAHVSLLRMRQRRWLSASPDPGSSLRSGRRMYNNRRTPIGAPALTPGPEAHQRAQRNQATRSPGESGNPGLLRPASGQAKTPEPEGSKVSYVLRQDNGARGGI